MGYYSNDTVFCNELDTAISWSHHYRKLSEKVEYAALIYSRIKNGRKLYYLGRTCKGMGGVGIIRANVVIPFIYLYTIESTKVWLKHKANIEAFVHTHPKPNTGYTYRSHSKEDLFLLKLPRINAVYVVPYENHELNRKP